MYKRLRKVIGGIRKQFLKWVFGTISCFCIIFVIFSYYDECKISQLTFLESSKCQGSVREIVNSTFIKLNFVSERVLTTPTIKENVTSKLERVEKIKKWFLGEESVTELPVDGIFQERLTSAENACKDLLNMAVANERLGAPDELKFTVGYTPPPIPPLNMTNSNFYNKNMVKLMHLSVTGNINMKRLRYFQTAGSTKRNRWVYFHRIVQSPNGPAQNKVVEMKWCPIFKAASTPWLAIFTKLSRALTNTTEAQIKKGRLGFMELAKTYRLLTPRIYDKQVHPYKYSMVIVRHPFKRLLSAYRDKIERVKGRLYYYNKYSIKILARYGRSSLKPQKKYKDREIPTSIRVPTFEQFVKFILAQEPKKLDEHWRPIFLDCNPCHKPFDFILKVETLNTDKDKVLEYLHVMKEDKQFKEVEDVFRRWNNPSGLNQPVRNESFYFSQLTQKDLEKLYGLYEPDFRIFDYSPNDYFRMSRD